MGSGTGSFRFFSTAHPTANTPGLIGSKGVKSGRRTQTVRLSKLASGALISVLSTASEILLHDQNVTENSSPA